MKRQLADLLTRRAASLIARRLTLLLSLPLLAQQHPRDAEIHDPDTLAWWHTTEALANDGMEGRDTGTTSYARAADYVAKRFAAAGLQPAGDSGSFLQRVPMHEIDLTPEGTSFTVTRDSGTSLPLRFLYEITTTPTPTMLPEGTGTLTFRGYCGPDAMGDVKGEIVLCFGTQRAGLPTAAERVSNARAEGALGVVNIDDPYFTIEPPRWPYAYARNVTLGGLETSKIPVVNRRGTPMLPPMRISAEAFAKLLEGTGRDAVAILKAGGAKEPLGHFDLPAKLAVKLHTTEKEISSPNVLAVLPGSDPALRDQYLVVAAHLDGYGFGTPVAGDNLYNGALDDAAYVALLIGMADDLAKGKALPIGTAEAKPLVINRESKGVTLPPMKRSVLFCAFTGEEKGLLGSTWFVQHPTIPVAKMAADVNLDQLRPLFPLRLLTALAIGDTTLGVTARSVGAQDGITLREDREPERGLLRRADHYPFLQAGVPAIGFVFGFDPGTDAEKRYRQWYQTEYHRPQDDLTQPIDFDAAAKFDAFFYRLIETIADDPERPRFLPGSAFAKAQ